MATNQYNIRGVNLTLPVPIADNGGVGPLSNEPLMFGNPSNPVGGGAANHMLACVAQNSYTPPTGVVNPDGISVALEGVWYLTVSGVHAVSPANPVAINPGDPIFADDNGTYDSVTGCYYGFSLNADSINGHYFGNSLDAVASGAVNQTVRVRLKVAG